MLVPLEVVFRDVERSEAIDALLQRRAEKLERICNYISSCRVAIERPQRHQRSGQPYRVRIDMTVPPGHEIVINRDPSMGNLHLDLGAEIRWAFDAAERRLKELMAKQRGDIKKHPHQEVQGVIDRIFAREEYGFIRTIDGRQLFFHKNSVLNRDFDTLRPGMGVNFTEEMGDEGPQASTIQVVDVPESL